MNWQDYIEEKLGVMMGKPVFKGTRITACAMLPAASNLPVLISRS